MIKRITMFVATALLALSLAVPAAFAASPSQEQCEAPVSEGGQGGTFDRQQGQVSCTVVDEGKNPKFTQETETTGQGNISNKQQTNTDCEGTGSDKCPPGQFK